MKPTIILAFDGSFGSKKALNFTVDFLVSNNTEVHVVTVLDSTNIITLEPGRHILDMKEMRRQCLEKLKKAALPLYDKSSCTIITKVLTGDVANELLRYSKEQQSAMIMCGARGRGKLTKLFLGSVAHKLVMYAECSVLVIR